jgi:glycosyltransferase involved in cell wall biosynthesis
VTITQTARPGGRADVDPGRVCAIVPAHNESGRIAATIVALRAIDDVSEILVVDDGSRDATATEAEHAGARVIRLGRNAGKGGALERGVAATNAGILLLADADLRSSAANLRSILAPVIAGEADLAIAAPPRDGGPSGFGLVEGFARWGIERLAGRRMDRPLSGQRAVRRVVLDAVRGFARGFGVETAFTVDALRAGYRVIEVPCEITHARTGRDPAGFVHRGKQGFDVARALVGRAIRR